jgi:2-amino-4-hydroxy-6-hydroxymethyldihydropteridine diphosphokinase
MPTLYIAIGTNLHPARNVRRGVAALMEVFRVTGVSTVYRTAPLGGRVQPAFYNLVVAAETALAPRDVKRVLRAIEAAAGRVRSADACASRPLDLDLLLCDALVCAEPRLVLPDPDIYTRPFLAHPLCELAPGLVLPDTGRPVCDVAAGLPRDSLHPLPAFSAALRNAVRAT